MSPFIRSGRRQVGAWRLLALVVALSLALAGGLASAGPALLAMPAQAAPAQPAGSVVQQAVQLDSPAVVRIVSVISASLTCAACASDGSDIHWPSDGSIFTYYSSGSGAFISPDGAILTADHVVDHSMNNSDDVKYLEQQAEQDFATQNNVPADQALQNHLDNVTITFDVFFQKAFLSTAYTGNLPDVNHVYAFPISAIIANSSVDDTAIARIDTTGVSPAPDFPYLTLSSAQVNPLDNVTAIAFPSNADSALGNADVTALVDVGDSNVNTIDSLLSSSVNTGAITKTDEVNSSGTPVYETTNIASSGSSGGPVINNQGQVIGFVDAGDSTNQLTFIIPSAVVAKYASQAGVAHPSAGRFMTLWMQALTAYDGSSACHWTTASNDLTTLKQQYPSFGGVNSFLTQAKQQATGESCSGATTGGTSSSTVTGDVTAGLALIGGCIVAVIALILGLIFLIVALRRRSKRRKLVPVAAAPYAAPYPPSQPPAYPAAGYPPATGYPPAAYPAGTRICPNGHAVAETDAAFCPICGAPLQPPGAPAR